MHSFSYFRQLRNISYISTEQYECWKNTQIIIKVVSGNGSMFSLENGTGKQFLTHSRLFSDQENSAKSGRK
ncbi:MAG: DUF779 domain-containing protein [Glaciimonas sp.]|nr:DUF779 domain-containing protein [Glaciimonas sp.]